MRSTQNTAVDMIGTPVTLDRRCWKVLKYLYCQHGCISEETLYSKFDLSYKQAIEYLLKTSYLESLSKSAEDDEQIMGYGRHGKRGTTYVVAKPPIKGLTGCPGTFLRLTPKAQGAIEVRPRMLFEHWLTIALAIWGAITGTIALLIDIIPYLYR